MVFQLCDGSGQNTYLFIMNIKNAIKFRSTYIQALRKYRSRYSNWIYVVFKLWFRSYPIKVCQRDGQVLIFHTFIQSHLATYGIKCDFIPDEEYHEFLWKDKKKVRLSDITNNGDLLGIFIDENYKFLNSSGKSVVDVGANVGDSSIYFALDGSQKVIAIEPNVKNFESLLKNITLNSLEKIVMPCNMLAGGFDDVVFIDPKLGPGVTSAPKAEKEGFELPQISLNTIVEKYGIYNGVLKVDCEGCEYDFIDRATKETLRRFERILIEYDEGIQSLVNKLEDSGFLTTWTPGTKFKRRSLPDKIVGFIKAERADITCENLDFLKQIK